MIYSHDFGISTEEYEALGKENEFPIFEICLNCKAWGEIHRHGFYWRNKLTEHEGVKIPICRYKCIPCKKTITVLPDFLIPYFQHTIHTILYFIKQILEKKRIQTVSRQLVRFHLKRFLQNMNWVHSFLVDQGIVIRKDPEDKKRAIKYLIMIRDFGESTFFRRSKGHLSKYFMAHSFYHV